MYFAEFLVDGIFVVDELLMLGGHIVLDALLDGLFRFGDLFLVVALDLTQLPLEIIEHLCLTRTVLQQLRLQFCLLFQRFLQRLQTTPVQSTIQSRIYQKPTSVKKNTLT